jgi:hypothetical protein
MQDPALPLVTKASISPEVSPKFARSQKGLSDPIKDGEPRRTESEGSPVRPVVLGRLIDAQNEQFQAFDEKYLGFLQNAAQAQRDGNASCLTCRIVAKVEASLKDNTATAGSNSGNFVTKSCDKKTGTFSEMFSFYSSFKVEDSGLFSATGEKGAATWSHTDLEG